MHMESTPDIDIRDMSNEVREILRLAVGEDYACRLCAEDNWFIADVKEDVEETSGWREEDVYTDDDIRYAIGRVICRRFGFSV